MERLSVRDCTKESSELGGYVRGHKDTHNKSLPFENQRLAKSAEDATRHKGSLITQLVEGISSLSRSRTGNSTSHPCQRTSPISRNNSRSLQFQRIFMPAHQHEIQFAFSSKSTLFNLLAHQLLHEIQFAFVSDFNLPSSIMPGHQLQHKILEFALLSISTAHLSC